MKSGLQSKPKFRFVEKGHREGEKVYAALGQTEAGDIVLRMDTIEDVVRITLTDWGLPIDAESVRPYDVDALLETRARGGMGLRLIHELMDDVVRETAPAPGGPNVLTMSKRRVHQIAS